MKKSFFFTIFIIGIFFTCLSSKAQFGDRSLPNTKDFAAGVTERALGYLNNLNTAAVRNFRKSFGSVSGESWSRTNEGYRATFSTATEHYLVDYNTNGSWRSTVRIFGEQSLPKDIRWSVKSTYIDYKIVTATELQYGKVLAYFIKLEGQHDLKTIRIMNDEMEVVEEFTK